MLATFVTTTATLSSNSFKISSFLTHFISVIWKQFAANDTFLREANGYKLVLTLRNARQMCVLLENTGAGRCNVSMLGVDRDVLHRQLREGFHDDETRKRSDNSILL